MEELLKKGESALSSFLFTDFPKIILAIIILWIGWKVINFIVKASNKLMEKKEIDISLRSFLSTLVNIVLKVLLVLTVVGMVGIPTTSFVAMIGAAGLAIGMALQGTLQNFAGGVIILLLKPYRVGDFIEQGSYMGTVKQIQIFNTILTTVDNKVIIIPNTQLATNSLVNYTKSEIRRVDITVGIAYGENIDKARDVLLNLTKISDKILSTPAEPAVVVSNLGSSSVDLTLRMWVKTNDYWDVFFQFNQAIYDTFNEKGIEIPFNQLSVQIKQS